MLGYGNEKLRNVFLITSLVATWLGSIFFIELSLKHYSPVLSWIRIIFSLSILVSLGFAAVLYRMIIKNLKKSQAELAVARQMSRETAITLETIVNSIDTLIIVIDRSGTVIHANRALEEKLGTLRASLLGRPLTSLVNQLQLATEDDRPYPPSKFPLLMTVSTGQADQETVRVKAISPDNFYLLSTNPIVDTETGMITGAVALLRDITELKKLEQLKDEFIGIVSHELKTPLAVIKGLAQLQMMINQKRAKALKEQNLAAVTPEILSPPTEETCLTKTIAEIDLMNKIIEQMVQITKIDSGKMVVNLVECDLVPLARDMVSTLALNLGEERLKLEIMYPEVRAKVDPSALQLILSNLISNAAKYSPETAPVIIRVYTKENRACIAVEDKGIGIPLADQKSVFSKFYRSSNLAGVATEGLGLGLYITARLVELQGGEINLTSTPGKGSTFEVQFPNL